MRWWEDTVYGYLKTRLNKPVPEPLVHSGRTADVQKSNLILGHDSVHFNIEVCTLCMLLCVYIYICTYYDACVYVFVHIRACVYARTCACLRAYIHVRVCGCMVVNNICVRACTCAVRKRVMDCVVSITI